MHKARTEFAWTCPNRANRKRRVGPGPTFSNYLRIGVEFKSKLPAHKSFGEIGKALGITKQNAYTETIVALGKLIYRLREAIK